VVEGERIVHIADIRQGAAERPADPGLRIAIEVGLRTFLIVPLRKDNVLLGAITAVRREVRPFSKKQIALLQNFARQAVIAMENARLITETREALEQQTATAEVLQVINSSPGDLAPVFDAILEKATQVCEAAFGVMNTYDGERFHTAAMHRLPPALTEVYGRHPPPPGPHSPLTLIAQGQDVVSIDDLTVGPGADLPRRRILIEQGGARSWVAVALRKEDALLGAISAYRTEVRPFTEKQIALLQNFAAQAVIAWRMRGFWANCGSAPKRSRNSIAGSKRGSQNRSRSWGASGG
jgi:GAF domain-containing protein